MPLSKRVANFNRYVTNPLGRLVAGRLIGPMVIVEHLGRTSGKRYRTPVLAFAGPRELIVVLTYGPDVDWLKNLRAGAGGTVVMKGRRLPIGSPEVTGTLATTRAVPAVVRWLLGHTDIDHVARLPLLPVTAPGGTAVPIDAPPRPSSGHAALS